jgi:hypothetical protein
MGAGERDALPPPGDPLGCGSKILLEEHLTPCRAIV